LKEIRPHTFLLIFGNRRLSFMLCDADCVPVRTLQWHEAVSTTKGEPASPETEFMRRRGQPEMRRKQAICNKL